MTYESENFSQKENFLVKEGSSTERRYYPIKEGSSTHKSNEVF